MSICCSRISRHGARLESLIARRGDDRRHSFVLVIPVADSPAQLRRCLASLLELCRAFGYGGMQDGYFRKIAVILADDTQDADLVAENRTLAREFDAQGLAIRYFGLTEQLALMDSLAGIDLGSIVGAAPRDAFGHKGQAMMRNIAYLELAKLKETDSPLLFYTLDADQQFKVKVDTADGDGNVCAVNFFAQLDAIFSATDADVLTGKVVGDPPVSPAVMAGNFLDDVAGFLHEMAASDPALPYRPNAANTQEADAAYHDMAGLFGFDNPSDAYRYRCALAGEPSNAACFGDFARRLKSFFHGEHPTRITWYRHQPAPDSVQAARTVYTGNYVFRPRALNWFIPFAPLRLRMSGPTLGRLMKAELGDQFISANLPMLHTRTLDDTGEAEFRPGVVTRGRRHRPRRRIRAAVLWRRHAVQRRTADCAGFSPAGPVQRRHRRHARCGACGHGLEIPHPARRDHEKTRCAVCPARQPGALVARPRTRRGARTVPRVPRQHAAQFRHGFARSCTHRLERTRAALAPTPARRPHPVSCRPRRLEPGARRPGFQTGMIERLRHALHRRRHPLRYAHLDTLLRTQALPRDDLLAKQQRDLADIVAFAAAHAPYYAKH